MIVSEQIYKNDTTGRRRFWRYEVDGARYRTVSGLCGGNEVVSGWTTCVPMSQDTAEEQALFEAKAEEKKKLERVYRRTVEELGGPMMFEPMLAKKYEDVDFDFPCYSQPKLDGIRCVATAEGLFSRQGKQFTGLPHIEAALKPLFDQFPDIVVDGELYNHDYRDGFEKIVSAVRKKSAHPDADKIQYHVYDVVLGGSETFKERIDFVRHTLPRYAGTGIYPVGTAHVGTQELLDYLFAEYMEQGFEGQMVRLSLPYENKRSKSLLKRKEFDDGEFTVVDILEGNGNWAGAAKKVVVRLGNGTTCETGLAGTYEANRELLLNKTNFIGADATVRYFGLTADGKLRMGVTKTVHHGKRST